MRSPDDDIKRFMEQEGFSAEYTGSGLILVTKDEPEVSDNGMADDPKNKPYEEPNERRDPLENYSEDDLKRIKEMRGMEGLLELAMIATLKPMTDKIMAPYHVQMPRVLSREVEDYFDFHRAKTIMENGVSLQIPGMDDRLGENLDHFLTHFKSDDAIILNSRKEEIERKMSYLQKPENEPFGNFMMRTPSEYFRLLIYYPGLKSFDDMKKIFDKFEEKGEVINGVSRPYDGGPMSVLHRHPVEFFSSLQPAKMEYILRKTKVSSVDDCIALFLEDPSIIPFLWKVDIGVLDILFKMSQISSVRDFVELMKDKDLRENLSDIDPKGSYKLNMDYALDLFSINDIQGFIDLIKLPKTRKLMQKAGPDNFSMLLSLANIKSPESLEWISTNEMVYKNIGKVSYHSLKEMLLSLGFGGKSLEKRLYSLITSVFDERLSDHCRDLGLVMSEKGFAPIPHFKDLVIGLFYEREYADDNFGCLCRLISEGSLNKKSSAGSLEALRKFTGGFLTPRLASEIVSEDDAEALLDSWSRLRQSFNEGNFNPKDDLHKELEYIRFRSTVDNERLKGFIKKSISFRDYSAIFDEGKNTRREFRSRDSFEISCAAYEAKLLKDYILSARDAAARLGKTLLVIPNLSYGYLPMAPIVDELSEKGVDFLMGVKVGSSDCHSDMEVIDSSLLSGQIENIMQRQPVIIVVDGTQHIVSRDEEDLSARYPDSYQGYLNQMIAINDARGFKDIDYMMVGKTESDMERLRKTAGFRKAVQGYNEIWKGSKEAQGRKEPYSFEFWNTAGLDMMIRNYRIKFGQIRPFDPHSMNGPTMVFCNVGVLHGQLPESIKSQSKEGWEHLPAYFDDSNIIINIDFGFNSNGVQFTNRLEDELRKVFENDYGSRRNKETAPAILKHIKR